MPYYAHTLVNAATGLPEPPEHWELLEDHLQVVAERASAFSEKFGANEWGYLVGLWHDLG